jgi:hypothetical protein
MRRFVINVDERKVAKARRRKGKNEGQMTGEGFEAALQTLHSVASVPPCFNCIFIAIERSEEISDEITTRHLRLLFLLFLRRFLLPQDLSVGNS